MKFSLQIRFWVLLLSLVCTCTFAQSDSQTRAPGNIALINGRWFNGASFDSRTMYSVDGRFAVKKPARIDRTIDLGDAWIVPPFAEAHNHNIGEDSEARQLQAIKRYLADGVFYVKIQGNLPLDDQARRRLGINRPDGVDVLFANGGITGTDGHPVLLLEDILLPQGVLSGHTKESLRDVRYFVVDSDRELEEKWPLILSFHPDFIKTLLLYSNEYDRRKSDPAFRGRKGLDPRLLTMIVARAHASGLRVTTHVVTAMDFHNAVTAGVDEIAHLPPMHSRSGQDNDPRPIAGDDAQLAAARGIVVITTASILARGSDTTRAQYRPQQIQSLRTLQEKGVAIAIGSDNVSDSSVKEFEYLRNLNVFDNQALLKMWTLNTPKTIFPNRRLGELKEGYEASFLALEGNPLENLDNVRKIRMRFKQGLLLED